MMFIKRLVVLFVLFSLPSKNVRASFSSTFFSKKILPKQLSNKKVDKSASKDKKSSLKAEDKKKVNSYGSFYKGFNCGVILIALSKYIPVVYYAFNHSECFETFGTVFNTHQSTEEEFKVLVNSKDKDHKILPNFNKTLLFYDSSFDYYSNCYSESNTEYNVAPLSHFAKIRVYFCRGYYVSQLRYYAYAKKDYLAKAVKKFNPSQFV